MTVSLCIDYRIFLAIRQRFFPSKIKIYLVRFLNRVATVGEKYLENEIFSWSGNFVDGQGNLERTLKVREKSGNLKKKMAMVGSLQKIYSVQEGKGCTFSKIV